MRLQVKKPKPLIFFPLLFHVIIPILFHSRKNTILYFILYIFIYNINILYIYYTPPQNSGTVTKETW